MNENPLKGIKAVLFDLDGVLYDGTQVHYQALNKALSLFGFGISREQHESIFNGLPTKEKLNMMKEIPKELHPIISKQKSLYTLHAIELYCRPSYDKIFLLRMLKARGLKLAICSNATTESVNLIIQKSLISEYFDLVLGNTSGFKPKPDPEIYIEAMKLLGVSPNETIIIEDSPHGIEAAKKSGANVTIVRGYSDVSTSLFIK